MATRISLHTVIQSKAMDLIEDIASPTRFLAMLGMTNHLGYYYILQKMLAFPERLWLILPLTTSAKHEEAGMKEKIHPQYQEATITCICGNVLQTRSTVKEMKINTCSACHPFYTGTAKYVDTAGRVEQFKKRYGKK